MTRDQMRVHDVQTSLPYLKRDELYMREKPFGADFPVDQLEGAQFANHILEELPVTIRDVRGAVKPPSLDENGFCFLHAETSLHSADVVTNRKTSAVKAFLDEIEGILYESFPEYERIEIMDYQVRKRAPSYPKNIGAKVDFEQPAALPHTDFSVSGSWARMRDKFPGQEKHYEKKSFDLLNIWRVLEGPNDDWPLALCDFQSVDLERDVIKNDCLHAKRVGENWLLHPNQSHRWFYMSGQQETDLIVFRNTDSEGKRARSFHAAFFNPLAKCKPRSSIEVRVVAIREG